MSLVMRVGSVDFSKIDQDHIIYQYIKNSESYVKLSETSTKIV